MIERSELLQRLTPPLLAWYDVHARVLPWRGTDDPYRIWLSEIMLQQTRVQAVIPYYERFLAACPTVDALAALSQDALFKLWEGLGYYSRARNLHAAAKELAARGAFPRTAAEWKALPGVGDYTAAAVASIAFGEVTPAVDGNLLRVAARVTACADDVTDAKTRRAFTDALRGAIDPARPGAWNQAMMDLGATVCLTNGAPLCERCPAAAFCAARRMGLTETLPVRAGKKQRRVEERTVFLLRRSDGCLALHRRPDRGLLAGLWEFPNVPGSLDDASARLVLAQRGLSVQTLTPLDAAKHIFTHVEWDMHGYCAEVTGGGEGLFWADEAAFSAAAIPSAFQKYTAKAKQIIGGDNNGTALL